MTCNHLSFLKQWSYLTANNDGQQTIFSVTREEINTLCLNIQLHLVYIQYWSTFQKLIKKQIKVSPAWKGHWCRVLMAFERCVRRLAFSTIEFWISLYYINAVFLKVGGADRGMTGGARETRRKNSLEKKEIIIWKDFDSKIIWYSIVQVLLGLCVSFKLGSVYVERAILCACASERDGTGDRCC